MNRRALFDIGVAGPIAGFIVAVPALIIGLSYSRVEPTIGLYGLQLGEPLLLQFFAWLMFGPLPDTYDIVLHPMAFAAWFGFFITALNLIPIGQLDGGHVAYALFGHRQRTLALTTIPILLVLGLWGWPGWILWAFLAGPGRDQPSAGDRSGNGIGSRSPLGGLGRPCHFSRQLFPCPLLFRLMADA